MGSRRKLSSVTSNLSTAMTMTTSAPLALATASSPAWVNRLSCSWRATFRTMSESTISYSGYWKALAISLLNTMGFIPSLSSTFSPIIRGTTASFRDFTWGWAAGVCCWVVVSAGLDGVKVKVPASACWNTGRVSAALNATADRVCQIFFIV